MSLPESLAPDRLQRLTRFAVHGPSASTVTATAAFTGAPTVPVPLSTPDDLDVAFATARSAQRSWARRPLAERVAVIRRVRRLALQRREVLIDLVQYEAGKARLHAFEEVVDVAINASYYSRHARHFIEPHRVRGFVPLLTSAAVLHQAKGVVGLITPWNYPLTLALSDAIPALLAGNAVIVKPDIQTPLCGLAGAELFADAGLPEGLYQVVLGAGDEVGPALVDRADYVAFTGSTAVGRQVAERAGRRLIGCSLELGGKNASIVLSDAPLARSVEGTIRGVYSSAGQLCVSMERIYVEDAIYDRFVPALVGAAASMRLGSDFAYTADMGSLVGPAQLERVQRHLDDAVTGGAIVLTGGKARPDLGPYFFEPTLLTDVNEAMVMSAEETFGPIAAVYRVRDEHEAIASANASSYGLSANVWTSDLPRGRRVAAALRAGTVSVNEAYQAAWGSIDGPMGGMNDSGIGRRHGREGITKYTDPQTVATQRIRGFSVPNGMSQKRFADAMTMGVRLLDRLGRP